MKFRAILASLVLFVVTSNANAALETNGNLGFTMVNDENTLSWTLDLGVSMADAITGNFVLDLNVIEALDLDVMDLGGYSWSVIGGVNDGPQLGTVASYSGGATPPNLSASEQITASDNVNNYWTANGNGTNAAAIGSSAFYNQAGSFQGTLNGAAGASLQSLAGIEMQLFYSTAISASDSQFFDLGVISLDRLGNLTYGSTTVIPVPAAVWLFGSVLAGMFGFARRRTA